MRLLSALGIAVALLGVPPAKAEQGIDVSHVCFEVRNPGDPFGRAVVYGDRFLPLGRSPSRAVLLLHGSGDTRRTWDLSPDFSVARRLAEAGNIVIAYDRLGVGESIYERPQGFGYTLTLTAAQAMLHQIVQSVRAGTYGLAAARSCMTSPERRGIVSQVVVIGHSGGGAIVGGYDGLYDDVDGIVQSEWSGFGFSAGAAGVVLPSAGPELARGNDYAQSLPAKDCERYLVYRPGSDQRMIDLLCAPSAFTKVPAGEYVGIASAMAANPLATITRTRVPVLLTWVDHSYPFTPTSESLESRCWQTFCACHVDVFTQRDSGHGFQAHRSMPSWVDAVVTWMATRVSASDDG